MVQQKIKNPFQRIVTSMYLRFFVNNRKYLKLIKCVISKTGSPETRLTRETCHKPTLSSISRWGHLISKVISISIEENIKTIDYNQQVMCCACKFGVILSDRSKMSIPVRFHPWNLVIFRCGIVACFDIF